MRYLLLSAETVFCTGAREAARCRKASPAQKLRVLRTQLSAVQLGMEMKAETAPEKSRSTGQNPRRPWGPPVTCSQLVLLGYLGFLEARLNWNHWIGSGRKQTDNLRCDSWQEAGRKKCRSWKRVAVCAVDVDLNTAASASVGSELSSMLEHSDKPGTPNLYLYNCLNLNLNVEFDFLFFWFQLVGSTCWNLSESFVIVTQNNLSFLLYSDLTCLLSLFKFFLKMRLKA